MAKANFIRVLKQMEAEGAQITMTLLNHKAFEGKVHRIDETNHLVEFQSMGCRVYIDLNAVISIEVR
jgi:predicted RNA-binding protein